MSAFVETRISLRTSQNTDYEAECPILATLAPTFAEFGALPKQWDCGPLTFAYLVDWILERNGMELTEREAIFARVIDGKAILMYRGVTVERDEKVPENRLWPF